MKLQGWRKLFFFLVERHLNPGSFNPWFFNYELFNPGLSEHEFWNHGVEKSGPNPKIFENKYWELAVLKISVFLSRPFWNFFCFIPMKTSQSLLVSKDGSKFWPLSYVTNLKKSQKTFVAFCSFFPCSLTVFHRGRQQKSRGRQWKSSRAGQQNFFFIVQPDFNVEISPKNATKHPVA